MKTITLLCILIACTRTLPGQSARECRSLTYAVMKGKDLIGSLSVTQTKEDSIINYNYELRATFRMLLSFYIKQSIKETFINGSLQSSLCKRTVDDDIKIMNTVMKKGTIYKCEDKDEKATVIKSDLKHSAVSLYFIQPPGIANALAENYLEVVKVSPSGADGVQLTLSNGNKMCYSYANGVCSKLEATGDWGVVLRFLLVSDSSNIRQ